VATDHASDNLPSRKALSSKWADGSNESESSSEEVDRLLRLAEKLQQDSEDSYRRLAIVRGVEIAIMLIGLYYSTYLHPLGGLMLTTIMIPGVSVFICISFLEFMFGQHYKKSRRRDQRALGEIVGLLRETQHGFAMKQDWSNFRITEFRIRLAQFDIV